MADTKNEKGAEGKPAEDKSKDDSAARKAEARWPGKKAESKNKKSEPDVAERISITA